ncbi:magnesium transporter CorA family protein [Metabacillus sp. Hm71]|uniref:magnesium transporter CorA family protein n=1 Tax=Metabacillus sp. Hm71 TaxID=3450743 RepID=UPI003F43FD27
MNKWKWYQYNKNELEKIKQSEHKNEILSQKPWLDKIKMNDTNYLEISHGENGAFTLKGSLVYDQNFHDEREYKIFQFFLTQDKLVTVDLDLSLFKHANIEQMLRKIAKADKPIDGFLFILLELLAEFLIKIDDFENKLRELIWKIHKKNKTSILEDIYKRRHDLLVWSNLLIPLKELIMGIEEACHEILNDNKTYALTAKRIKRALYLIDEYEHEIHSIITLEEVISTHRGNEIMKTLTVMTAIFTPAMAWGAIWGMNFKFMPELEWKYGYFISIIIIALSMIAVYIYLKMKGWTGDLLKGKKKGKFFK